MNRKIISLVTLMAFIIFSLSCYNIKKVRIESVKAKNRSKVKILGVFKSSGEYIEFSKEQPGKIYKESIRGTVVKLSKLKEINKADIQSIKKN